MNQNAAAEKTANAQAEYTVTKADLPLHCPMEPHEAELRLRHGRGNQELGGCARGERNPQRLRKISGSVLLPGVEL